LSKGTESSISVALGLVEMQSFVRRWLRGSLLRWRPIRARRHPFRSTKSNGCRYSNPDKILCVGVNYETHRQETGRKQAAYPTIFLRLANTQTGHGTSILRPKFRAIWILKENWRSFWGGPAATFRNWKLWHMLPAMPATTMPPFATGNRTPISSPGEEFSRTGAFGPWMTTADEIADIDALHLTTRLNGVVMQEAQLDQLIFSIPQFDRLLLVLHTARGGGCDLDRNTWRSRIQAHASGFSQTGRSH